MMLQCCIKASNVEKKSCTLDVKMRTWNFLIVRVSVRGSVDVKAHKSNRLSSSFLISRLCQFDLSAASVEHEILPHPLRPVQYQDQPSFTILLRLTPGAFSVHVARAPHQPPSSQHQKLLIIALRNQLQLNRQLRKPAQLLQHRRPRNPRRRH